MSKSFLIKKAPDIHQGPFDPASSDQMASIRLEQRIVRRGAPPPIVIHSISEDELRSLARGAPDSSNLSVGISLISTSLTLVFSLSMATLSNRLFAAFFALSTLFFGLSLPFILIWIKERKSSFQTVENIRKRLES